MRRLPTTLALAGLAVLAAGCSRAAPPALDPRDVGVAAADDAPPPAGPAILYFVNSSTVGADVFVAATARDERRLGTVQPGSRARFELPREAIRLGSTNVLARLHPSTRSLQTGALTVNSGDVFTVSLGLGANTLAVSPGRP